MTTAEKRAQLGDDWPNCRCHDAPMLWQKHARYSAGGYFFCRPKSQTIRNTWRERRATGGLCAMCGAESEGFRCRNCLDNNADYMAQPEQMMLTRSRKARERMRGRAAEGFHPTGVGRQLAANYLREVSNGEV